MLLAFTVSLKHRLRFEPFAHYPDIQSLVGHLDTFAKGAHHEDNMINKKKTPWKVAGEYLGLSVANSNPRKELKRADRPLGNLPLEILTYLSAYIEETSNNGTLKSPVVYGQIRKSTLAPIIFIRSCMLMKFPNSQRHCLANRLPILCRASPQHSSSCRLQHPHFPNRSPLRLYSALPTHRRSWLAHHPRHHRWGLHHRRPRSHW